MFRQKNVERPSKEDSGSQGEKIAIATVAFTQMKGSSARNVIPPEAEIVANMRLNPSDSVTSALDYLKKTVNTGGAA